MSRIVNSGLRVDHVLVDVDLPPCGSEIDRNIVGDVQVSVQLEDSSERSVERVVESSRVVSSVSFWSHEHLRVGWSSSDGFLEGPVALEGSSTSPAVEFETERASATRAFVVFWSFDSHVETSEGISSSDLSRDVEVGLVEPLSTGSSRVGPISGEGDVDCRRGKGVRSASLVDETRERSKLTLSSLIDSDSVDIESLDHQAGELHEVLSNRRLPISETILDGRELGELTLPIRAGGRRDKIAKSFSSFDPTRAY